MSSLTGLNGQILSSHDRWTIWNGKNISHRRLHSIQEVGPQPRLARVVLLSPFEQFHLGESME
jgi:hypothetical protein